MSLLERNEGSWQPETESEKQIVLIQVKKLVDSSYFRNSKRYPNFLQFIVEQTLQQNEDSLKERLLGMNVFHRGADYDTSSDPVVRLTAAEIRKRLTQYYLEPKHCQELRIELKAGSYVPKFHLPPTSQAEDKLSQGQSAPTSSVEPHKRYLPAVHYVSLHRFVFLASGILLTAISFCVFLQIRAHQTDRSAYKQLWSPILEETGAISIIVPSPSDVTDTTVGNHMSQINAVNYADSITMANIVGYFSKNGKDFRLRRSSHTTYTDLQDSSSILIGGWDNVWTRRLTDPLRFHFGRGDQDQSHFVWIVDQQHPVRHGWAVNFEMPISGFSTDYALIARIFDKTIGHPILIIAGIGDAGTAAASEFVLNPAYTRQLSAYAPLDWKHMNMEAVISTHIVDGQPGPPTLISVNFSPA